MNGSPVTEADRQAADLAIRRGQRLSEQIEPCSCMKYKFRQCYGTCKDAVDCVAAAIAQARREGMEEVSRAWFTSPETKPREETIWNEPEPFGVKEWKLTEISSYASTLAFEIATSHPDCIKDDVPLDDLISEIAAAIDRGRRLEKGPGFLLAHAMAKAGYADWAGKEHNAKWVRKIEGTPIPNDLVVCIAEAVADGRTEKL